MNHTYVLVPEIKAGQGTGHMRRSAALARRLPRAVIHIPSARQAEWRLAIPDLEGLELTDGLDHENPVYIVDQAGLDPAQVLAMGTRGPLVGIDTRGPEAAYFDYVIDTLPRLRDSSRRPRGGQSNISDRGFLSLPPRTRSPGRAIRRILVSFGGEDSQGQTSALYRSRLLQSFFPDARVDWVRASRMADTTLYGWDKIDQPRDLKPLYQSYDLLIGLFGLSAYEALASGCLVLLWNPTAYHEALARQDGFVTLGWARKPVFAEGRDQAIQLAYVQARDFRWEARDLSQTIQDLRFDGPLRCCACGEPRPSMVDRFPERTFFACGRCGTTTMRLHTPQTQDYGEQYFFEAYQQQYGRTYLEDFNHIKAMGVQRLRHIRPLARTPGRLLDIGCAYGPFLSAAREAGYRAEGLDISPSAAAYCRETLGIPARTLDIMAASPEDLTGGEAFQVVTLWYVIEHFPRLDALLEKISSILAPGGVLALSTPSMDGISALQDRRTFLSRSPMDHYSIWSPRTVRKLLARHGFTLRRIRGTGHHPERFRGLLGKPALAGLTRGLSEVFLLGDTFELYAQKTGGSHGR